MKNGKRRESKRKRNSEKKIRLIHIREMNRRVAKENDVELKVDKKLNETAQSNLG